MSEQREAPAEALAEHLLYGDEDGHEPECSCGVKPDDDEYEREFDYDPFAWHRAHLADILARLLADAEQRGADRVAAAVEALHFRRPWMSFVDSVTFGQSEFPDQCNHCRRSWPCETIAALTPGAADRVRAEEGGDRG